MKNLFKFAAASLLVAATTSAQAFDNVTLYNWIGETQSTVGYNVFEVDQATMLTVETFEAGSNTFGPGFDPVMYIFEYSNGVIGNLVGYDDDSGTKASFNYNAKFTDTFDAGTYIVAVSTYDFSEEEARGGYNPSNEYRGWGSYTLTISAVPEPSTYALMLGGLGLVGFMAARRKKV